MYEIILYDGQKSKLMYERLKKGNKNSALGCTAANTETSKQTYALDQQRTNENRLLDGRMCNSPRMIENSTLLLQSPKYFAIFLAELAVERQTCHSR